MKSGSRGAGERSSATRPWLKLLIETFQYFFFFPPSKLSKTLGKENKKRSGLLFWLVLLQQHPTAFPTVAMCLCSNLGCFKSRGRRVEWYLELMFFFLNFSLLIRYHAIKFNDTRTCLSRLKQLSFFCWWNKIRSRPRSKTPRCHKSLVTVI